MEIEHMKEFIVLGNCLGFSRAAGEMFISQSTLSRHIASIEKEMGYALIRRNTHSVELTPAGEIVMERFRSITSQYEVLLSELNSLQEGYHGNLRLGTVHFASERYMMPFIRDFSKTCPAVDLRLSLYDSFEMRDAILNGQIEAGLTVFTSDIETSVLGYQIVGQERIYIGMSNGHRLSANDSIHVNDLKGETLVLSKHDNDYNNYVEAFIKKSGIEFGKRVYSIHLDTIAISLTEHNAVAFLPDHIRDQARRDIILRPFNEKDFFANIMVLYHKDNTNPALKLFLKVIN